MRTLAVLIASIYLPVGATWSAVEPVGQRLVVSGPAVQGNACEFLLVDRRTLGLRGPLRRACARPPASAHPVVPVEIPSRRSPYGSVRIGGRVVLRYEDVSDARPLWTWGGGSLWLYDVATPHGALALRFDAATGKLLQTVRMPRMFRPALAANEDGLWLAPAPNGGISGGATARVYRVAPGSRRATLVHAGGRAAIWFATSAHEAWAEIVAGTQTTAALWRFDAHGATRIARRMPIGFQAEYGSGALWELTGCEPLKHGAEHLVRVDPSTGAMTFVARVPAMSFCGATLAYADGSLFVLDAPRLFRITP
ncbi:MAG: hypothetical protein ACYDCH_09790 [Gaiellaceae bacterium]